MDFLHMVLRFNSCLDWEGEWIPIERETGTDASGSGVNSIL